MRLPVLNCNGFTFEKETILEWLKTKNECPLTKNTMSVKDLRLNKNAIMFIEYLIYKERFNNKNKNNNLKIKEDEIYRKALKR